MHILNDVDPKIITPVFSDEKFNAVFAKVTKLKERNKWNEIEYLVDLKKVKFQFIREFSLFVKN